MSISEVNAVDKTPYRDGAPIYAEAGWDGIIPIRRAKKTPALAGITGRDGLQVPAEMSLRYHDEPTYAHCNIAIRMPLGVVGIDVDDYDSKSGATTLAELEAELGQLPRVPYSSARGPGVSGIKFFKVPENLELEGVAGKDIEIIQHHHRYALVSPSIHPKTGEQYRWYHADGSVFIGVPHRDELEDLPEAWVNRFRVESKSRERNGIYSGDAGFMERFSCEGDAGLVGEIVERYYERESDSCAHDAMVSVAFWGACLAVRGEVSATEVRDALEAAFLGTASDDPGEESPESEFARIWAHAAEGAETTFTDETGELVAEIPKNGSVFVDNFSKAITDIVDLLKGTPLYQRGGRLVEIGAGGKMMQINRARLSSVLVSSGVRFLRKGKKGPVSAHPTGGVLDAVLEYREFPVPELRGVVTAPFFQGDEIVTTPGYHAASRTFMSPELPWREISEYPSGDEVSRAKGLLEELVRFFPFSGEHSRGNFFAYLLTPPLLGRIGGPVKGFVFSASSPRSGKSKLAYTGYTIWSGTHGNQFTKQADHEARDAIRAYNTPGAVYVFDNFDDGRQLKNSALSSALTTTGEATFEKVGTDEGITVSVDKILAFTGNNIGVVRDFEDKVAWVRLVPKVDPTTREDLFDYGSFVREERVNLVWAVLTLIRAYDVSGNKDTRGRVDGFESWRDHVGSILRFHGLAGEIDPREDVNASADWAEDDRVYLEAVAEFFGGESFLSRDVVERTGEDSFGRLISPDLVPRNLADNWDPQVSARKRQSAVGGFLDKRVGQLVSGRILTATRDAQRRKVYRFVNPDEA
ncbi:bifunctional DNA primase/polymerase [Nocardiopsis sp. NPDC055824]